MIKAKEFERLTEDKQRAILSTLDYVQMDMLQAQLSHNLKIYHLINEYISIRDCALELVRMENKGAI